jgi:16S rRNA (cytosine967-C5)-methyltransferase
VDAPCSGLGVLRRRPDARWRIVPDDVAELVALQASMLDAAVELVRDGGVLVYSVCTLTSAETTEQAAAFAARHADAAPLPGLEAPWREVPAGGRLLPQDAGTDGMAVFRWRIRSSP